MRLVSKLVAASTILLSLYSFQAHAAGRGDQYRNEGAASNRTSNGESARRDDGAIGNQYSNNRRTRNTHDRERSYRYDPPGVYVTDPYSFPRDPDPWDHPDFWR